MYGGGVSPGVSLCPARCPGRRFSCRTAVPRSVFKRSHPASRVVVPSPRHTVPCDSALVAGLPGGAVRRHCGQRAAPGGEREPLLAVALRQPIDHRQRRLPVCRRMGPWAYSRTIWKSSMICVLVTVSCHASGAYLAECHDASASPPPVRPADPQRTRRGSVARYHRGRPAAMAPARDRAVRAQEGGAWPYPTSAPGARRSRTRRRAWRTGSSGCRLRVEPGGHCQRSTTVDLPVPFSPTRNVTPAGSENPSPRASRATTGKAAGMGTRTRRTNCACPGAVRAAATPRLPQPGREICPHDCRLVFQTCDRHTCSPSWPGGAAAVGRAGWAGDRRLRGA